MSEHMTATNERKLWFDGPNYTADSVIIHPESASILLIKRKTGEWALPGGFVDTDEPPRDAAIREASEEAAITVASEAPLIFRGIVDDPRNSEEAWIETSAYLFTVDQMDEVTGQDDAIAADWHALGDVPELYASHEAILARALDYLAGKPLVDIVASTDTRQHVGGGHMEYDKSIVPDATAPVFIKSHNPARFSDPRKAERSYAYLEKEAFTMAHLRHHGFTGLPDQSALHHHDLAMNALRNEDGWQWRADPSSVEAYIQDASAAFAHLETMPVPADSFAIDPSRASFMVEGWWAFDDTTPLRLQEKSQEFMDRLTPESQQTVAELLRELPALRRAGTEPYRPGPFVFCHHDVRQSNLAWHPNEGAKLIDWSWAGVGEPDSDITSLLIDLHKSGHDISNHHHRINPRHCLTLMGFWLGHSTWPHRGDDTVRFQQFLSAVSAYEVLREL